MDDGRDERRGLETRRLTDEDVARRSERGRLATRQATTLLLIYSRDGIQAIGLTEGLRLVVGRAAPADVVVRDASLSRRHAAVELADGQVWIEDLGSTNGTRVAGQRIERRRIGDGDELIFGGVPASLQAVDPLGPAGSAMESHDRFRLALQREVARAREFVRPLSLAMLSCQAGPDIPVSRWFPGLAQRARPYDQLALYGPGTVEWLLPEATPEQAAELIGPLLDATTGLRCGLAGLPANAASAEALIDQARTALTGARSAKAMVLAPPASAEALEPVTPDADGPVAASRAMRKLFTTVDRLAGSVIPVLLIGETGSGKEVVARAIHERGPRASAPLICVNCGGIPAQLVESTLFGHEAGAFTGAGARAKGVFEAADGGTVLLDEIGELPAPAQAALLRVLEDKRFTRVGSTDEIAVDVRVLAATHRDLEERSRAGTFREDLLYRLNAMTLTVPPLRDRPEDIPALAARFVEQANQDNGCQVGGLSDEVVALLSAYPWPGNVRELRNAMARAVVIAEGEQIQVEDLPDRIRTGTTHTGRVPIGTDPEPAGAAAPEPIADLKAEVARYEAALILRALEDCDGDRTRAAEQLGLPVRTLAYKMKAHGIRKATYDRDD